MISSRLAAAIAAGILVAGILVGSAGAVLLGLGSGTPEPARAGMHGSGAGMMGGWDRTDMLDEMGEHMGYGRDSQ